jgi:hypothetical protein
LASRPYFLAQPPMVWHIFENNFIHMSREVGGVGR